MRKWSEGPQPQTPDYNAAMRALQSGIKEWGLEPAIQEAQAFSPIVYWTKKNRLFSRSSDGGLSLATAFGFGVNSYWSSSREKGEAAAGCVYERYSLDGCSAESPWGRLLTKATGSHQVLLKTALPTEALSGKGLPWPAAHGLTDLKAIGFFMSVLIPRADLFKSGRCINCR